MRRVARHFRGAGGAVLACLLLAPAAAHADTNIVAGPSSLYLTPNVSIDQGEPLTFYNFDAIGHDVTASADGPDGKPQFSTPIIGVGESAFVEGSQYLTTGTYEFICSIHVNMRGSIDVTSAGTPAERPTPGNPLPPDTTAPALTLKLRSARAAGVRRSRKLPVEVSVDEPAKVTLKATVYKAGRTVTVAKGSVDFTGAGRRRPSLALTAAGRKALKKGLKLTLSARAVDRAGNAAAAKTSRRL